MPTRLIIAYSLIALLTVAAAAWAWWIAHHSPKRVEARRRARTLEQHARREQRRALAEAEDVPAA